MRLEIAAAGGHNVILIGPPGAGKTMLVKRLPTILPDLSLQGALDTTKIYSVEGMLQNGSFLITRRPFRSPYHTISDVALIDGGSYPYPGVISLAHNGVLFLDELPELKRSALGVLRQPMEERKVTISRSKIAVDFPACFMLIASMNPWGSVITITRTRTKLNLVFRHKPSVNHSDTVPGHPRSDRRVCSKGFSFQAGHLFSLIHYCVIRIQGSLKEEKQHSGCQNSLRMRYRPIITPAGWELSNLLNQMD